MTDQRVENFARILVEYCTRIQPGDRVYIEAGTPAIPILKEVYKHVVQHGGQPYLALTFPEQDEIYYEYMPETQIAHKNELMAYAYEKFEARIRLWSENNTSSLSGADPKKQAASGKANADILKSQFTRGAAGEFKWVTTMVPTHAYAMQAHMGYLEYENFLFKAMHALDKDPISYWKESGKRQQSYIDTLHGHDKVELRGPNVDLTLSIKDRTFNNSVGLHNMPDGEIFTGPVETSLNGWVRYTYPAILNGHVVEGVELHFTEGKVSKATARTEEAYLLSQLAVDEGASYVGEFAIGLNDDIDRFTGHILLDEKIGGSFHMALGAGYPETGSQNHSAIHWDMICDLRTDSEMRVDGEVFYKNGIFTI